MGTSWIKVKDRLKAEVDEKIKKFSSGIVKDITDFYPELKDDVQEWSTDGFVPLLPGLMTSPHIIVDLYDWENPSVIIEKYGVDLDFLLELRDYGEITLLANLPPESYNKPSCEWLFPLLADERTLFRSLRTPAYFRAKMQKLEGEDISGKKGDELKRYLEGVSDSDLQKLLQIVKIRNPVKDAETLARVLLGRYESLFSSSPDGPEIAESAFYGFYSDPLSAIAQIQKKWLIYVSPDSHGLGGDALLSRQAFRWLYLSGDEGTFKSGLEHVPLYETEIIEDLNQYLMGVSLGLEPTNLSSAEYWSQLDKAERDRILRDLEDKKERREIRAVEGVLRREIFMHGTGEATIEKIQATVKDLENRYDKLVSKGDQFFGGIEFVAFVGGTVGVSIGDPLLSSLLLVLGLRDGTVLFDKVLGGAGYKALGRLIPKLQIVQFVKKHRRD